MAGNSRDSREQPLVDAVSTERLMAATRTVAREVRLSGTPEEARAFDWIEQELRRYGLEISRYSHPSLVSWPESASLAVATGDGGWQEVFCSTHAFVASTPLEGLEGELVFVGRGSEEELRQTNVAGKIALVDGLAAPNRNLAVEKAGAIASLWISGDRLRERILSPVWGTPTPETAHLLPRTPSVSIKGEDGARLRALLEKGTVRVKLVTSVFRGWKELPCLVGDLRPEDGTPEPDSYVLLSGHVDSWYYGAIDNGTANATMLEVARVLAQHRSQLRRGFRVAFWSGHSHGRYSGSAWYADNFWEDLHDHCVAHVYCDSMGAMGASTLTQSNSMPELREFGGDVIEQVAGQRLAVRRYSRAGDQSFWGHGVPSLLMTLSRVSAASADPALAALSAQISGGKSEGSTSWWWHTADDTLDKVDPDFLRRDTLIYLLIAYRLCSFPLLPMDYGATLAELRANLASLESKSSNQFDFSPVNERLAVLASAWETLRDRIDAIKSGGTVSDGVAGVVNCCLMRLGRALIPIDYTVSSPFDHDLAVPTEPLPSLQAVAMLPRLRPGSDDYEFLRTRLVRERNRVVHGLVEATRALESALSALPRRGDR